VVEGRGAHQGPDVDGTTTVTGCVAAVGDVVTAVVTEAAGVDLVAVAS
jgi:ribosomal protein S12 methylthiotransferase